VAVDADRVTVTTTATSLDLALASAVSSSTLVVRNRGAVAVYLGGSDVTDTTGWQLDPGETLSVDLRSYGPSGLFGITTSGSAVCHVCRLGF
jgi:hypothetical protein